MEHSRASKVEHFYSLCQEGMTVLDVGVSREARGRPPQGNYFLKTFRYPDKFYTGLGVEDLTEMPRLFPGKRFVQYPGGTFPFKEKEFDWVFSNAVVEHVGDDAMQLQFINEMLRVARNVFFTTPNKYFPLETHTNAVFIHWNNSLFYGWYRKTKPWVNKYRIYLFSYNRLNQLMNRSDASYYEIYRNRFWGLPMTFTVVCKN